MSPASSRLAFMCATVLLCHLQNWPANSHDQRVGSAYSALSSSHSLVGVLQRLEKSGIQIALAELPVEERVATGLSSEVGLQKLLDRISTDYHFHVIMRGRVCIFQKRYASPGSDTTLEHDEVAQVALDLHKLLRKYGPYVPTPTTAKEKILFYASLTTQQKELAKRDGLPISALSGVQRRLWTRIHTTAAYGAPTLQAARGVPIFSDWPRNLIQSRKVDADSVHLEVVSPPGIGVLTRRIDLGRLSVDQHLKKKHSIDNLSSRGIAPRVVNYPVRSRPYSGAIQRKVRRISGHITLKSLVEIIEADSSITLDIPEYAMHRKLLAVGQGSAYSWLTALEDLYGWELRRQTKRSTHYYIGRPSITEVKNAVDLHNKVRSAISPPLHHLWSQEASSTTSSRSDARMRKVFDSISTRLGANWKSASPNDMDQEAQRLLSLLLLDGISRNTFTRFTSRVQTPAWQATPESGFFRLSAERSPEGHPLLHFGVVRSDGKVDGWGWYVGTSSFERGR